jgi:hypothetical protein
MRITWIALLIASLPVSASAWGQKGHLMVNRLAIEIATQDLPPFMGAAAETITYNGYEPDRWREEFGTPMAVTQAADHFLDSEFWGDIMTLEPDRYAFMKKLQEKKVELITVGYAPYAIIENYGKLRNAFRFWRNAKTPEEREAARANAVYIAGVMGHYVADTTQPMHMSLHYNGWADGYPNPKNFTKDRTLHSRYESAYVDAAIDAARVRPLVVRPKRLPDVFGSVKEHLSRTFSELEPMYEMEKTGEFKPESPRQKGTDFITAQIARAATMLSNLWYTAWIESGEPIPPRPRE